MNGITVVIPCYKEDEVIVTKLYCELTMLGAEVIVVDDGNFMDLPDDVRTVTYRGQMGYGFAIKQGIKAAKNPLILTMDGDFQHTTSDAQMLAKVFQAVGTLDMLVGQRWDLSEKWYRFIGRKFLNFLASILSRHYMVDLNSGMRIFRKDLALGYEHILCDTFSFTTSLSMSFVTDGYKTAYIPITVKQRLKGKSRVKLVTDGLVTLWYILWIGTALRTRRIRAWKRHLFGGQ